jgi:hypothetical protein
MNQGLPILTDPKKERMTFSVLSGAPASGQIMATGSVMLAGSGLLSVFDSKPVCLAPRQGFYHTRSEDNQKTSFPSPEHNLVFYLDSPARVDYKGTFNLYK